MSIRPFLATLRPMLISSYASVITSRHMLDYDEVMGLANALYFNTKLRTGRDFARELKYLATAGCIYATLFASREVHHQNRILIEAIDRYGHKAISKRLMALILQDKYLLGHLMSYHGCLIRIFCRFEHIGSSMISQGRHTAFLRKAWAMRKEGIRTRDPPATAYFKFPEECLEIIS